MDNYLSQISLSAANSAYNSDMTTTHDGLVTIKHEPVLHEHQEIEEDIFPVQATQLPSFVIQEPIISNQRPINNYKKLFQLKDCYVRLEKCDKIWETLKVIKNLQIPGPNKKNKILNTAFGTAVQNQSKIPSPMHYQPVLNNGNSSLPNFQLAIKSWKRLYTCTYCGKQYVDNRSLKAHLCKLHNVNPEPELPRPREIPLPIEIPRPVEIPRPKEFPRPAEVPQFHEFPRPIANAGNKEDFLKPFVCTTCGVRYSDARSLAGHSLRVHGILTEFHEKWLAQQENPNDFTVEDLLKRHACNSCDKRYSCMKSLRLHYLRDHNYVLPLMRSGRRSSAFKQPSMTTSTHTGDLQKHMNVCTICGKKYTKNWYLRVHCLEVHGIPMICNRGKKNFKPGLRVIKKEVLDEPESNENLPTDMNFPMPQVKNETPLTTGVIPVKNVYKMYQCTACKMEFIAIAKLRTHCLSRHGIIIPRIRKSYKKSNATTNPNAGSMEAKMQNDTRMQVSTPKQVSLDRYFKSPINGEISFHKVPNTIQNFTKRDKIPTRELTIIPQVEKPERNFLQKESPPAKSQPKAPVSLIKCNLCSSNCKDIRKHYIAYHKIRYPETVMKDLAPSASDTSTTSLEPEKQPSDSVNKKQPPKKRRRKFITMGKKKKRKIDKMEDSTSPVEMSVESPSESPTTVRKLNESPIPLKKESPKPFVPNNYQYKCNICGGYYSTPRTLKVHRQRHRMKGETKANFNLATHNYKNIPRTSIPLRNSNESFNEDLDVKMRNDSRTSSNENITQSSSTSDSGDSNRKSDNSSRKSYSVSETTCECGRGFRDPHTMYLHKDKCPTMIKIEREKMTVARSSSDRDSGIGISITIKKKNDSYEIVSRDSGDDDKSKDSSISKDSDQMSHSSDSNFSSSVFNDRKFLELIPGQCSKDHSVLKIEDADDDVDVDIEDDSQTNISESESTQTSVQKKEAKSNKAIAEQKDDKSDDDDRMIDPLEMDLYRCAICLDLFKDMDGLTKHMLVHESTRVLRQNCPCGKTFRGAQSFLTHVEEYHPLWLQCGYCDVTFLSSKEYVSHSCDVNKEGKHFDDFVEIVCHYCLSKVRMCNFESHVKTHHFNAKEPFLCFFCKMRFSTKKQRSIHVNADHAKPNCRICGKSVGFAFVAKHEAYHQGLGFPCHTCKKAFTTFKHLKYHRIEVHTTHEVKSKKAKIKDHVPSHTLKEKCKLCSRGFFTNISLENHIKQVHRNKYPFLKCESCGKKYVTEKQLKKHVAEDECKKKVEKPQKIEEKSETVTQEPNQENPLNGTVKTETPDDGNHSEMEESVDMDEPLALEASSDTEGLLEAAESTLNDITDQSDCLEPETSQVPPVDDALQGEKTSEKTGTSDETETVTKKEIATVEEIPKDEKIANETKTVDKTESVETAKVNATENLELKEVSDVTETLPEKETPNAESLTTEGSESKEAVPETEILEPKEPKEPMTEILELKETTEIMVSKETTEILVPKETTEILVPKETTEIPVPKETTEILVPKETTETAEEGEPSTRMETSQEEQVPEPSGISETEPHESSDPDESINLTDTFGSDDTDTSQIDVTGVSCNSTAKSEEILNSLEIPETGDTSESMEVSGKIQVDT